MATNQGGDALMGETYVDNKDYSGEEEAGSNQLLHLTGSCGIFLT